jgi:sterol 3beta-glucosyltransferase
MSNKVPEKIGQGFLFVTTFSMDTQSSSTDDGFANGSPALPRLFSDASLYKRFLNEDGSEHLGNLTDENEVVKGFIDLVAVDLELDSSAKAVTDRLAKLAVTSEAGPFAEPESYGPDSDTEKYPQDDSEKEGSRPLTPPNVSRSSTVDRETPALTPGEIVNLLIQEFGPLAAGGEEEKLIIEADAAWIHDIVILASIYFPHISVPVSLYISTRASCI